MEDIVTIPSLPHHISLFHYLVHLWHVTPAHSGNADAYHADGEVCEQACKLVSHRVYEAAVYKAARLSCMGCKWGCTLGLHTACNEVTLHRPMAQKHSKQSTRALCMPPPPSFPTGCQSVYTVLTPHLASQRYGAGVACCQDAVQVWPAAKTWCWRLHPRRNKEDSSRQSGCSLMFTTQGASEPDLVPSRSTLLWQKATKPPTLETSVTKQFCCKLGVINLYVSP